ncbi:hypothetical protein PENTCL1PPCAC_15883 [Pristionchus entomophagus]|uniref:Activin types I and II receptor domain-containing protein n=1 Tax=Pristionchus entomophagus TaxID=358040 RepID=A0AAV5THL2_9BILA|nr:hypothetical protein PENTCL1PPCAC_15883 [Pristionchus entomophagus]
MRSLPVLFLVLALLPLSTALKCDMKGWGPEGLKVDTDCSNARHCYLFQVAGTFQLDCDEQTTGGNHRCTAPGCTTDTALVGDATDVAKGKGTLCCCDTDKCDLISLLPTTLVPVPTTPDPDPTTSASGPVGLMLLPLAAVAAMAAAAR